MDNNKNLQPDLPQEDPAQQALTPEQPEAEMVENAPAAAEEETVSPAAETEQIPAEIAEVEQATAESAEIEQIPVEADETEQIPVEAVEVEQTPLEAAPQAEPQIEAFEDTWIDQIMDVPMVTEEIGVDESVMPVAGLEPLEEPSETPAMPEQPQAAEGQPADDPPAPPAPAEAEAAEIKEPNEMAKKAPSRPAPAEPEEAPERRIRKIRPRDKSRYGLFSLPHLAATVIWLAVIVFVGVGLGNILWEYASDMLAFGREDTKVIITISEDDDLDRVSEKLLSAGLIKYPSLFKLYANLSDAMEDINPGTYTLNTLYDYNALVDSMSSYASRVTANVVIPEGYNCQQIFRLMESKGISTVAALQAAANRVDPEKYWFLEGVENTGDNWLEGYLFPDTYTFYLNHNPDDALEKLLLNFDKRYTDIMRRKLAVLNGTLSEMMRKNGLSEEYIASHQMTLREIVIIASMIEKESANTTESYTIASVIYNRLTNPNAHPYLQIDAALVYVTGHSVLTMEDLALDNPYNTYKYPGLIPGPISNPSQASLAAALEPDETSYYYYALNPETGVHKFSETLDEHEAFLDSLRQNNEE